MNKTTLSHLAPTQKKTLCPMKNEYQLTCLRNAGALTLLLAAMAWLAIPALAQTTDFESFTTGTTVNYQGSGGTTVTGMGYTIPDPYGSLWTVADEWGFSTIGFDEEVQDDGTGNIVWRFSNAVAASNYSEQPNSNSSPSVAGETGSALYNDRGPDHTSPVSPAGPRASATTPYFHGGFRFKSATGSAQTDLELAISPIPRQTSFRMSYLAIIDTGSGFDLSFYDTSPSGSFDGTTVASGLSYADWHNVEIYVEFVDGLVGSGAGNDIVTIVVNGTMVHTGTTWESYFAGNPGTSPIAVDALLFRASSGAAGTLGNGLFFDDVTVDNAALVFDDQAPVVSNLLLSPNPAAQGSSVDLTATASDVGLGDSDIASASYTIDGGSSISMAAFDGSFDSSTEDVEASVVVPSEAGIYEVCVSATDAEGNSSMDECTNLVVYDPSAGFATGGGWISSPVGALAGWGGDGELSPFTQSELDDNWEADRFFPTDGATSVSAFGRSKVARIGVNSSLTQPGTFQRTEGIKTAVDDFGQDVSVDLYVDPDWADKAVRAGFWVVGDDGLGARDDLFGILEFVSLEPSTSGVSAQGDHVGWRYWDSTIGWTNLATPFSYGEWVTLRIELDPIAEVYNYYLDGSYVASAAGGQNFIRELFINSYNYGLDVFPNLDNGSYAAHWHAGGTSGRATFGFVSKYKKGANVPTGATQFQFKDGNLNFHSNVQDWLVVNQGGTNAQFKGSGTVNGSGDYGFMIWASDGDLNDTEDTFRIKIWEADTEAVVYDTGTAQAIGGGNIKIHTGGKGKNGKRGETADGVPTEFALGDNYPNPFNPATRLSFDLPEASSVRLTVFDAIGRRVAVLADGSFDAGTHAVTFNADSMPSGLYLYRIEAGSFTQTKRMLLLK